MDAWLARLASQVQRKARLACQEYIGREVRDMTAADIILIFIGIIGLLISFGSLIVAFLSFLDKSTSKKN